MAKQEENALLLAKFIGWKEREIVAGEVVVDDGKTGRTFYLDDLKFNSSWDWIMPVLERIEDGSIKTRDVQFKMRRSNNGRMYECVIKGFVDFTLGGWFGFAVNVEAGSLILAVYKAAVEFIRWYNKQIEKEGIDNDGK